MATVAEAPEPAAPPAPDDGDEVVVDPFVAEVATILGRVLPPVEPPNPDAPAPPELVALEVCRAAGADPEAPAAVDEDEARTIRQMLQLPDDEPVSNGVYALFYVLDGRAEDRWRQLDEQARVEGWRTAHPFARLGPDHETWQAGRERYDAGFEPPPKVRYGARTIAEVAPDIPDPAALMGEAIREAARIAKADTKAGYRGVEIRTDGVHPY